MAGFWENDALAEATAPAAPKGNGFWENDALAGTAPAAPQSEGDRAISALTPFFEKGVSTRNSAGQWTGEARALLSKAGLNPDGIDHKAEKSLLATYEGRTQPAGDGAAAVGRGLINGIPIAGPVVLGGVNRAAAFIRSVKNGTSYNDELKNVEGFGEKTEKEHPWATKAGEFGGAALSTAPLALAAPAAFGAGEAALGTRMALSGLTAGGMGAADSAVRSEGDLTHTLIGGGVGGVVGGLAPGAGALVGRGVNAALGALAARRIAVPGAGRPAATKLTEDLRNSGGAGPVRERLDELGPEAMLLDASPSFEGRAQGLATMPQTRETINAPITARAHTANDRLRADLDTHLGPSMDPEAYAAAHGAHYDEVVPPLYQQATREPVTVDTSGVLQTIRQLGEEEKGGAHDALQRAWNLLHTDGDVPGVGAARVPDRRPGALHNAKEELDAQIARVREQQGSAAHSQLNALTTVRRELNSALEAQVPGYEVANRTAQHLFQQEGAFNNGQLLLNGGREAARPAAVAQATAAMTPEVQQAQRLGLRTEIDRLVGTQANDRVALQKAVKGEGDFNRARMNTVLGEEPTAGVVGAVDREAAFDAANRNIVLNSQSAQRVGSAKDMAIRDLMPDGGVTGIGIAGAAGGPAGAAIATGAKAAKIAANAAGRASDIARNQETAAILTMRAGPERDAVISALEARVAAASRGEIAGNAMDAFVLRVLQSQNDRRTPEPLQVRVRAGRQ